MPKADIHPIIRNDGVTGSSPEAHITSRS